MTVRLDIHTHVGEMFGFQEPTPEIAETIIARIKDAGLDGIAVTDHWRRDWGDGAVPGGRAALSPTR